MVGFLLESISKNRSAQRKKYLTEHDGLEKNEQVANLITPCHKRVLSERNQNVRIPDRTGRLTHVSFVQK